MIDFIISVSNFNITRPYAFLGKILRETHFWIPNLFYLCILTEFILPKTITWLLQICRREHLLDLAITLLYQIQVHWPTPLEALLDLFSSLDQLHQSILQIGCFFSSCFASWLLQFCHNCEEYYSYMQAKSVNGKL